MRWWPRMKVHEHEDTLWLPRPVGEVFAFFADARNLDRLTPPWLGFHIRTPLPITMAAGSVIDYRLRWRWLVLPWRSQITAWEPPHRFVYEQRRGPYRLWRHEHRYVEERGGTRVIDRVWWSVFADRWLHRRVAADVGTIFRNRLGRTQTLLVDDPQPAVGAAPVLTGLG